VKAKCNPCLSSVNLSQIATKNSQNSRRYIPGPGIPVLCYLVGKKAKKGKSPQEIIDKKHPKDPH